MRLKHSPYDPYFACSVKKSKTQNHYHYVCMDSRLQLHHKYLLQHLWLIFTLGTQHKTSFTSLVLVMRVQREQDHLVQSSTKKNLDWFWNTAKTGQRSNNTTFLTKSSRRSKSLSCAQTPLIALFRMIPRIIIVIHTTHLTFWILK